MLYNLSKYFSGNLLLWLHTRFQIIVPLVPMHYGSCSLFVFGEVVGYSLKETYTHLVGGISVEDSWEIRCSVVQGLGK